MKWRILIGVVLVAALGWSAWWFVGSTAHQRGIEAWLADRRAAGWRAEVASVETAGFPNRFDTRLTDLALADPRAGWAWSAPFLDLLMLSYKPTQAVLVFPPEQSLATPAGRATLATEDMRASARLAPGPSLALERVSAEVAGARLEGPGWTVSAEGLQAHLREAAGEAYDLHAEVRGLRPPAEALATLGLDSLPATLDRLAIDGQVTLDRRLDRHALEDRPPAIRAIDLARGDATWGRLSLHASGRLEADARGFAEGELDVRATNWREMLRAAVEAGALERDVAALIETGLSIVAGFGGDRETIEAPFTFREGRTFVGPIPIGPAPRLAPPPPV